MKRINQRIIFVLIFSCTRIWDAHVLRRVMLTGYYPQRPKQQSLYSSSVDEEIEMLKKLSKRHRRQTREAAVA